MAQNQQEWNWEANANVNPALHLLDQERKYAQHHTFTRDQSAQHEIWVRRPTTRDKLFAREQGPGVYPTSGSTREARIVAATENHRNATSLWMAENKKPPDDISSSWNSDASLSQDFSYKNVDVKKQKEVEKERLREEKERLKEEKNQKKAEKQREKEERKAEEKRMKKMKEEDDAEQKRQKRADEARRKAEIIRREGEKKDKEKEKVKAREEKRKTEKNRMENEWKNAEEEDKLITIKDEEKQKLKAQRDREKLQMEKERSLTRLRNKMQQPANTDGRQPEDPNKVKVKEFGKSIWRIGVVLETNPMAFSKGKSSMSYLQDLGMAVKKFGLLLEDLRTTKNVVDQVRQLMGIVKAFELRIVRLQRSQNDENKPKDAGLSILWKEHKQKTEYPLDNTIPKWILWSMSAVVDEIWESLLNCQRELAREYLEAVQMIWGLLDKEMQLWDLDSRRVANPASTSWGLQAQGMDAKWTTEKLQQQLTEERGLVKLNLQDCGLTCIPEQVYELPQAGKINVLELSGNFIYTLPKEVSMLRSLKEIRMCCSKLRKISEGALGDQLEVLSLVANKVKCLPADVSNCQKLRLLNLSWNDLEELPSDLRALEVLNLEHNEALCSPDQQAPTQNKNTGTHGPNAKTSAEDQAARNTFPNLIICHGYDCSFSQIPKSIMNSKMLRYLNMGHTKNSEISKLQTVPSDIGSLHSLTELYLHFNEIEKLPTELTHCDILQEMHVQGNPLKMPKEVLSQGMKGIINFLKESGKAKTVVSLRFRVPMLGDPEAGKSSFVDSLIAGTPKLANLNERTYVLEHKMWKPDSKHYPGEKLYIQFDDFGGHECYKQIHVFFLSQRCTPIICVRVDLLSEETFDDIVTPWLETTKACIPKATFHLLMTQKDRCKNKKELQKKLDIIREKVQLHERSVKTQIEERLWSVKDNLKSVVDSKMRDNLQKEQDTLHTFLDQRPDSMAKVHAASSTDIGSVKSVASHIFNMCENLGKDMEETIPETWENYRRKIKAVETDKRYLPLEVLISIGRGVGLDEESTKYALNYLHLCGDVLWYHDGPMLKDIVFHEPSKLVDVIKTLITHDIKDIKRDDDRFCSLDDQEFLEEKDRMSRKGLVSRKLLWCLWSDLKVTIKESDLMKELLLRFDLCFAIPRSENVFDAKKARDLMFPWLLSDNRPSIPFDLVPLANQRQIAIKLVFSGLCPASFFPALSVRLNKFVKNEEGGRQDWKNGTFGVDENGNVFLLELMHKDSRDTVLLKVRGQYLTAMWHLALPIHIDMKILLRRWPGVIATFRVPCPRCPLDRKLPCDFTADYLWEPHLESLVCPKDGQAIDSLLMYPAKEALEGITTKDTQLNVTSVKSNSPGQVNFQRVWLLLDGYGVQLLRQIFGKAIQPMSLEQWLLSYQPSIQEKLKDRPLFTYGRLYQTTGHPVELSDLTCTILLDLFATGNVDIEQPSTGWDHYPPAHDKSTGACILRFKQMYDKIAKKKDKTLIDKVFSELWESLKIIITAIGGESEQIAKIKEGKLY